MRRKSIQLKFLTTVHFSPLAVSVIVAAANRMSALGRLVAQTQSPTLKTADTGTKFAAPVKKVPASEIKKIKQEKSEVKKNVEEMKKQATKLLETPPGSETIIIDSPEKPTLDIGGSKISFDAEKSIKELARIGTSDDAPASSVKAQLSEVALAAERLREGLPLRKRAGEEISSEKKRKTKKGKVVVKPSAASPSVVAANKPGTSGAVPPSASSKVAAQPGQTTVEISDLDLFRF